MIRALRSRARARSRSTAGRRIRIAVPIALLAFAFTTPTRADPNDRQEQIFEQARFGRQLWIDVRDRLTGLRYQAEDGAEFGARYDDSELSWIRSGVGVGGAIPIGSRTQGVAVSFSFAVVDPIVDGTSEILDLPGTNDDPFDPMLDSSLGFGGRLDLVHGFDVESNIGLSARQEFDAEFVSALAAGGSLSFGYRYENWLRLRLGFGLGTAIDHANLRVSPVFRLRIRPMRRVWIETDGTSGRIEWTVGPRLELGLFGGADSRRYRLESRGRSVGSGSLELRKTEVGIGLQTRLGRRLRLRVQAAVVLGQHLSVFDDHRDLVDARDTNEPSGALRFRIEWQPATPQRDLPEG